MIQAFTMRSTLRRARGEPTTMMFSARALTLMASAYCSPLLDIMSLICSTGSHLLTTDHDLHRRRRKPLEPFFSRQGIERLQPMLAEVALHLEERLREMKGQHKLVRLDHAFSAFSGDIIGRICLDGGEEGRFLDDPDFGSDW